MDDVSRAAQLSAERQAWAERQKRRHSHPQDLQEAIDRHGVDPITVPADPTAPAPLAPIPGSPTGSVFAFYPTPAEYRAAVVHTLDAEPLVVYDVFSNVAPPPSRSADNDSEPE